ncbi:MAG: polysaccharide deacetylase family protein, partial [Candidatus Bathyarchaeia archaeon]
FDADPSFFGLDEAKALHEAGHEIGDHTKTHRDLTKLSEVEIRWEIDADHLKALGIKPRSHAYPYGSYNKTVIQLVSQNYDYARTVGRGAAMSLESPPINTYSLNGRLVEKNTSIATVKEWIDEAVESRKWLILVFHNIVESPSAFSEYSVSDLQEIVTYAKTKGITVKTLSEVSDLLTFRSNGICPPPIDDFNRVQIMSPLAELDNHPMTNFLSVMVFGVHCHYAETRLKNCRKRMVPALFSGGIPHRRCLGLGSHSIFLGHIFGL